MKYTWWLLAACGFVFIILFGRFSHASECLSSAKDVRAVHGMSAHSYWGLRVSGHEGQRCWSNQVNSRVGTKPYLAPSTKASASHASAVHGPNSGFDSRDGSQLSKRREVMPEKRPLETASEVMQTHTAESALSAAVLQPPTPAEQRIIALLTEMGWVDYLVRVNQIVDNAYNRWINEVCSTPKLQDRCPHQGR